MKILNLDNCQRYFLSEEALSEFVKELKYAMKENYSVLTIKDQSIGLLVNEEAAKEVLMQRILKQPNALEKLRKIIDEHTN